MGKEPAQTEAMPKVATPELPPEKLELRPGDAYLTFEQLLGISVFKDVGKKGEGKLKGKGGQGAIVLRRFRAGEIICRQGDPGFTAFYILKTEDLLRLREAEWAVAQSSGARSTFGRADEAEIQSLREQQRLIAAAEEADRRLASIDPTLTSLEFTAKMVKADEVQASNAALAGELRASAKGAEARAKAVVSLTIHAPPKPPVPPGGLIARFSRKLFGPAKAEPRSRPRFIPIDGPCDLNYENPIATLYDGELFGEMSCINYAPRSATVRASHDCHMIEMLRNVLETLLENETFKNEMDAVYRRRVLANHLREIPIFQDAPESLMAVLRDRVELVTKQPGEVIFDEGAQSDSVYVIRIGTVKVYRKAPGGERVIAYRSRGEVIGEVGLLTGKPRGATCAAYEHPRGEKKARAAGPTAPAVRVELVRIGQPLFQELCSDFPDFGAEMKRIAEIRMAEDVKREQAVTLHFSGRVDDLGLMQGQKLMLIDLDRCTRCDECVRACVDTHDDGLTRLLREGPRFGKYLIPSSCRQCMDPVCMIGCPVGSIHKGKNGQIIIEDWCIGCSICAQQCPYDAINMHDLTDRKAVVCDQCGSLTDGKPSCVYACPHDAAHRVDAHSFFTEQLTAS